jgi:hypothetical protein
MAAKRMSREEFFAKLAPLDEDRLRKALWNLYWRGSASMRERIEAELDPAEQDRRKRAAAQPADPDLVLSEVREFAELARAGAYIAGDRRVSPKERTRWRVTFRRLAADAQSALRAEDAGPAEEALALIIGLACEMKDRQYFRSEDPVEAARFVVSDATALLWETMRDRHGFAAFAQRAAPQLLHWESRYGWTRGWGQVHQKETSLASVLAGCWPHPTRGSPSPAATWPPSTRQHAPMPPRRRGSMAPGDTATPATGAANGPATSPNGTACCWSGWPTPTPRTIWTGSSAIRHWAAPNARSCTRAWPASAVTPPPPASSSQTACANCPATKASPASRPKQRQPPALNRCIEMAGQ